MICWWTPSKVLTAATLGGLLSAGSIYYFLRPKERVCSRVDQSFKYYYDRSTKSVNDAAKQLLMWQRKLEEEGVGLAQAGAAKPYDLDFAETKIREIERRDHSYVGSLNLICDLYVMKPQRKKLELIYHVFCRGKVYYSDFRIQNDKLQPCSRCAKGEPGVHRFELKNDSLTDYKDYYKILNEQFDVYWDSHLADRSVIFAHQRDVFIKR